MSPQLLPAEECVVLLHGLFRSSNSMDKMESYLSDNGYSTFNISYESTKHSIEKLSESSISEALSLTKNSGCKTVHIVTHSMGGILVRDYLSDHTLENLGRVVMLGPPNQGSEVVDEIGHWKLFEWLNGPAGLELGTDSLSLPNQLGEVDFELGIIAGDRSINWINSIMIDGPDDGKVSVERSKVKGMTDHLVIHTTHTFMMRNNEVMEQTLHFLQESRFNKE